MNNATSNYVQSKSDKLILEAIEYILERKNAYQVKSKKQLLDSLQIHPTAYPQIKNKQRGFAIEKIDTIIKILHDQYQISLNFLRFGIKPVSAEKRATDNTLSEPESAYGHLNKAIEDLEQENAILRAQIADKISIIEAQALAIKNFKALYEGKN